MADRQEIFRRIEANDLIGLRLHFLKRGKGGHGYGNDHLGGACRPGGKDSHFHGGSGSDPVIHQDHRFILQVPGMAMRAIEDRPIADERPLFADYFLQPTRVLPDRFLKRIIDKNRSMFRHRPYRQLWLEGVGEFAQ